MTWTETLESEIEDLERRLERFKQSMYLPDDDGRKPWRDRATRRVIQVRPLIPTLACLSRLKRSM